VSDHIGNRLLRIFDVLAFLIVFVAMDPVAAFSNGGHFNFSDASAFILAFSSGCV